MSPRRLRGAPQTQRLASVGTLVRVLAPHAQVSLYPWKDTPDKIPLAVRHIRTFLRAHQPVPVAH